MFSNSNYAFVAGIFASLASFFGKLITGDNVRFPRKDEFGLRGLFHIQYYFQDLLLKIACCVAMVTCNAMVWTFFVKALHSKGGSLAATITSAATNYCVSVSIITSKPLQPMNNSPFYRPYLAASSSLKKSPPFGSWEPVVSSQAWCSPP
jgi:hypothetical protein